MINKNLIKRRLRIARKAKDLTLKQAANRMGVSVGMIHKYETGERLMSAHTLVKICLVYDCSADWILGLSDVKQKSV